MLEIIWNDLLYRPVFNGLIWIYNNWTNNSLGWAIVYLAVLSRVVLLPFTMVNEKAKADNLELQKELNRINREFAKDPVLKKEEVRKVLKKRKVRPWAKAIVLGIQALVLVLLYQVFLQGITGEKILRVLYPFIEFPGKMNTVFYGFDLGMVHSVFWAGLVAAILMFEIYMELRKQKEGSGSSDLMYFILFPIAVFATLYILPMVKALFILTSIIFSFIVHQFSKIIFTPSKKEKKEEVKKS
ncbi:YidC/Oxa1 family membrane protein insertase [Patescibacteria group bacterium]|nr:YidC/Oxa1 family membrane protein insertase [Patescibacteria group bacterium]MBU1721479.1 YidC/Oxa1 family membrane protein insertase [Patescibacteria group bacterium]MBU1900754.1 YidC/Oxa1 family membrane protein insertase [Patescibacteria group bacterium]